MKNPLAIQPESDRFLEPSLIDTIVEHNNTVARSLFSQLGTDEAHRKMAMVLTCGSLAELRELRDERRSEIDKLQPLDASELRRRQHDLVKQLSTATVCGRIALGKAS